MNIWLENSKKNLMELSKEKLDFKKAIKEWEFSGEMIDYGGCIAACELCEKDGLRYHFQIVNGGNSGRLLLGSKCIDKFDIKVIDEYGEEVTRDKNTYLIKRLKKEHVKKKIQLLEESSTRGEIKGRDYKELDRHCVEKYGQEEKLSPKMLNYLFRRFEEDGIDFNPRFFKMSLRKNKCKKDFRNFSMTQFSRIKKALSARQIQDYKDHNKF